MDVLTAYSRANRKAVLITAAILTVIIAVVDWSTNSFISIGFLYLFPMMLASGFLNRWQIICVALVFTGLQEAFGDLPFENAVARIVFSAVGFAGTGLFFSELLRNRRIVLAHLDEVQEQVRHRREAEEQLQILVDSSPAAILTVDSAGKILIANAAARELLGADALALTGQPIARFVPALHTALESGQSRPMRTATQCRAQRASGEAFLAGVWFSTWRAHSGNRLAAIIVDLSEELCSREDLSLDYLLRSARILMSAVSHEVRNLAGAALVFHRNLTRVEALRNNEDFQALGTLILGMEKLSAMKLSNPQETESQAIELAPVLDELRVLLETVCRNAGIDLEWSVEDTACAVCADRYDLIQAFLNLAKNSRRALESSPEKRIRVSTEYVNHSVVIRFEDTGPGIANPDSLFRAFQRDADATGLGLYVSRALLKSFGGDLSFETAARGCRFAVTLQIC